MGSSFNRLRCLSSYRSRAHFWKGATLSISPMFFSRPKLSVATVEPVWTSAVAVGAPQYPVFPGGGPNLGWPSGHFGVGPFGWFAAGLGVWAPSNSFLLPAVSTTEFAHTWRLPFRAVIP